MGDECFIECFVMILFGVSIKCLGFISGIGDFFEFIVDVFLDVSVIADTGVHIEEVADSTDFSGSKRIGLDICVIVLEPLHHMMLIGHCFLQILDCAVTKDFTSDDHTVALLWVICGCMHMKEGAELFFVIGKHVVSNREGSGCCFHGN